MFYIAEDRGIYVQILDICYKADIYKAIMPHARVLVDDSLRVQIPHIGIPTNDGTTGVLVMMVL